MITNIDGERTQEQATVGQRVIDIRLAEEYMFDSIVISFRFVLCLLLIFDDNFEIRSFKVSGFIKIILGCIFRSAVRNKREEITGI